MNHGHSFYPGSLFPASSAEMDEFRSLSEKEMFDKVMQEIIDGSETLADHVEKTQGMIAHNLACLKTNNSRRLHENSEPGRVISTEMSCIDATSMMVIGLTTIASRAKQEMELRCKLLSKIMNAVRAKGEESVKHERELERLAGVHNELKRDFERESESRKDLMMDYSLIENKCKSLEAELVKTKESLYESMKKSEKLSKERNVHEQERQAHKNTLFRDLETLQKEKEKNLDTITELKAINDDLCRKIHDMKAKEKQAAEDLQKSKTRAETAVLTKGTQEKQIFDLKGNLSAMAAACKTKDLEMEEMKKDFEREQEQNVKRIKKLEDDKEMMLSKKSESENLSKSLVFAFKAIKKIVPPESSSMIMEAIINMKPDSAVSYELDRIFVAISSSPIVASNKIMERVIELATNKRDISDKGSTEYEACDKICRYFRIINEQNSQNLHETTSKTRWSGAVPGNLLASMEESPAGMDFRVGRDHSAASKSFFSEDLPIEKMTKAQIKEMLRRKYK